MRTECVRVEESCGSMDAGRVLTWARATEGMGSREVWGRQATLLVAAAEQQLQVCCSI